MENYYLFVHFIGESEKGEQIYFSISKDGLNWTELNNSQPVLESSIGEKGIRDPFIVKHPKTDIYYLLGTDLSICNRKGDWSQTVLNGSQDIIVWESTDLVNWSEPRACNVGLPEAGCVWAPEAVYDKDADAFLVFWASTLKDNAQSKVKHQIYASHTTDFRKYTSSEQYIEREQSVIDTTIVYKNNMYYRFTKDEESKKIVMDKGQKLLGDFREIGSEKLSKLEGVEGPQVYPIDNNRWVLIVDRFAENLGYTPYEIYDFDSGDIRELKESFDFGKTNKRHGGVIQISEEEYKRLLNYYHVSY